MWGWAVFAASERQEDAPETYRQEDEAETSGPWNLARSGKDSGWADFAASTSNEQTILLVNSWSRGSLQPEINATRILMPLWLTGCMYLRQGHKIHQVSLRLGATGLDVVSDRDRNSYSLVMLSADIVTLRPISAATHTKLLFVVFTIHFLQTPPIPAN